MAENEAIMKGETPSRDSVNTVRSMPENFVEWTKRNEERIARAKYRPYFVRDNQRMIDNILNPQKPSAGGRLGGKGYTWNGNTNYGVCNEVEVILQRGAKLRVTKAEYKNGQWFIDFDVIEQPKKYPNIP